MKIKVFCGGASEPFVFDNLGKDEYENVKRHFTSDGDCDGFKTTSVIMWQNGVLVAFNTSRIDAITFEPDEEGRT